MHVDVDFRIIENRRKMGRCFCLCRGFLRSDETLPFDGKQHRTKTKILVLGLHLLAMTPLSASLRVRT
jgi:hypothetical protein